MIVREILEDTKKEVEKEAERWRELGNKELSSYFEGQRNALSFAIKMVDGCGNATFTKDELTDLGAGLALLMEKNGIGKYQPLMEKLAKEYAKVSIGEKR